MNSSLSSRAAERVALAYQPDVHPAARALLDAIAQLHSYEPASTDDLAQLLRSIGGDTSGATSAVSELGDLVKHLARHPVTNSLTGSGRTALARAATEYGEVVLQGEAEEYMNDVLHVLEEPPAPAPGMLARAARALGGGR
ncbi:hypothetical protein [Streptomyces filamentosus]|uniref:hypothetical protein n=1 Tax=Streptomyces filamentosus TaxID=67294 RepID=UPI0033D9860A